ncbi:hypothetical protein AAVH_34122 [Aphelenchoides avenae]|nr:hypothetical protein AAVH_34122 [Aphelenchus avenae]
MPGPLYKPVEVDRIRDYVCYYVETKGVRDMAVLAAKDPLLSRRTASGLERRIYRLLEDEPELMETEAGPDARRDARPTPPVRDSKQRRPPHGYARRHVSPTTPARQTNQGRTLHRDGRHDVGPTPPARETNQGRNLHRDGRHDVGHTLQARDTDQRRDGHRERPGDRQTAGLWNAHADVGDVALGNKNRLGNNNRFGNNNALFKKTENHYYY